MKTSPPKRPDWLPHPCLSFSPTLVSPLTSPFPIRPACTIGHVPTPGLAAVRGPLGGSCLACCLPVLQPRGRRPACCSESTASCVWHPWLGLPSSTSPHQAPESFERGLPAARDGGTQVERKLSGSGMGPRGGDILGLKRLLEELRSGRIGRDTRAESWCGVPTECEGLREGLLPTHSQSTARCTGFQRTCQTGGGGLWAAVESG